MRWENIRKRLRTRQAKDCEWSAKSCDYFVTDATHPQKSHLAGCLGLLVDSVQQYGSAGRRKHGQIARELQQGQIIKATNRGRRSARLSVVKHLRNRDTKRPSQLLDLGQLRRSLLASGRYRSLGA